jgi:multiple RNA-binding domain-containing protein 1
MGHSKTKSSVHPEIDEDDPEFKEFMNLQRNIGKNSKFKHVWSDDAKMDAENVAIPPPASKKPLPKKTVDHSVNDDETDKDLAAKKSLLNPDYSQSQGDKPRKRHKRSRPKKKSSKAKPKEIFVNTIKIKGVPEDIKRKGVIEFFKPLELLSIRLNKKDRICYVSFKDKSDMMFAMRKDGHFWGTSRIKCVQHNVKRSKVYKLEKEEKRKAKEEQYKKYEAIIAETEPVEESGRIFIRNLNYNCKQEDLEEVFSKYGELTEVHFPIDKQTRMPKGFAYVEFMFPKDAARAYEELNGTEFQGRAFHLIPSKPKPEPKLIDGQLPRTNNGHENQSSFKREKMLQQKQVAPKGSNWNILFLGQNALADVVSESRGVDKSKLLTQQTQKEPIAVRMALGDASAVDEMRKFLISNGVELDSFDNPQAPRSKTVIIVKNLPSSSTNKQELQSLFEHHGRVARIIIPPNGLTALVEMEEPVEAKLAFKKLAYSKFKDSILYLEWAPINVFREKSLVDQERTEMEQLEKLQTGTKILIKNVPFEATPNEIKKIFAAYGELNFVRLPRKVDGQHRGFAFVDYLTKEDALRAFRGLCHSTHLYGRKLVLEWAK